MLALVMVGVVFGGLGGDAMPWQLRLVNVVGTISLAALMGWLIVSLPQRGPASAKRVRNIAWSSIATVLLYSLVEARMAVGLGVVEKWKDAWDWPAGITWMVFLIAYLDSSKRARVFYGLPAGPPLVNGKELPVPPDEMAKGIGVFLLVSAFVLLPIILILFIVMYFSGVPL